MPRQVWLGYDVAMKKAGNRNVDWSLASHKEEDFITISSDTLVVIKCKILNTCNREDYTPVLPLITVSLQLQSPIKLIWIRRLKHTKSLM